MIPWVTDDYKGLRFTERLSHAQWKNIFRFLGKVQRMCMFYIGDAILECERQHGEKAPEFISELGLSVSQLLDSSRVASRFAVNLRDTSIGFSLYRDAGADMAIARPLLKAASNNGWSRDVMRRARRQLIKEGL